MFMYLIKQKYMYMSCNKISLTDFFLSRTVHPHAGVVWRFLLHGFLRSSRNAGL